MNLGLDISRLITEKILARKTVQYWYYHETEVRNKFCLELYGGGAKDWKPGHPVIVAGGLGKENNLEKKL